MELNVLLQIWSRYWTRGRRPQLLEIFERESGDYPQHFSCGGSAGRAVPLVLSTCNTFFLTMLLITDLGLWPKGKDIIVITHGSVYADPF